MATTSYPPPGFLPNLPSQQPPDAPVVEALATPPIQLRNTYPAGTPFIGAPPKPLGKTPTSFTQLMFPAGAAANASHFAGPVVSGLATGVQGAAGSAQLVLCLQVDYTMGNFQLPIQFPGGSFLQSITAVTYATGFLATGGINIDLGLQSGASDVAVIVPPAKGVFLAAIPPGKQLPMWDDVSPLVPFQCWINVTGNATSSGGAILLVTYTRLAGPWSGPAK